MYFAVDSCNVNKIATELLVAINDMPQLNWFALVDTAFDYEQKTLIWNGPTYHIYDYDGMEDLLPISPSLLSLSRNVNTQKIELHCLFKHRRNRPMLSFIGTTASLTALGKNFQRFTDITCHDDTELIFRFADTRVLLALPALLRPEFWETMTDSVSHWIAIDRVGKLQSLPIPKRVAFRQRKLVFSSMEFAAMLEHGEPDAVIDAIASTNPEVIPARGNGSFYNDVAQACKFAKTYDVSSFPDLVALATLAIATQNRCFEDPRLCALLVGKKWSYGKLIEKIVDFVE